MIEEIHRHKTVFKPLSINNYYQLLLLLIRDIFVRNKLNVSIIRNMKFLFEL